MKKNTKHIGNKYMTRCDVPFEESRYGEYTAKQLYELVKEQGCKKFKFYLNQAYLCPADTGTDIKCMANNYVRIKMVDKTIPIILTPSGWICDGQHRVARAIADGDEYIWAYRLFKWPETGGSNNETT